MVASFSLIVASFFRWCTLCFSAQASQRVWFGIACSRQSLQIPSSLALSRQSFAAFLEASLYSGGRCLGPSRSLCPSGISSTLGAEAFLGGLGFGSDLGLVLPGFVNRRRSPGFSSTGVDGGLLAGSYLPLNLAGSGTRSRKVAPTARVCGANDAALTVSECLSLCPADPPIISLRPEVTGNKVKRGPRGPHPRRLGGVPGGSGVVSRAKDGERPLIDRAVAGNSPVYSQGCKFLLPVAEGVAGKPSCKTSGRKPYFRYSSQGCSRMTVYGYARVSIREPEDKNLDLQVERLVRAGCSMGNVRAEEASGAKDDRGGLLELLDLVVEGDTLVVTHIDRLSRGLTHGLQVIEGLHHAGVGVPVPFGRLRHLDGHRQAPTRDGARLQRVVAQLDQGALGRRPGEGAGRGAFPRPEAEPDRAAKGLHPGGAVEGSEPAGNWPSSWRSAVGPSSRWTGRGWVGNAASARSMASWDPTQVRFQDPAGERPNAPAAPPRIIAIPIRPSLPPSNGSPADNIQFPSLPCSQLRYSEQSHSSEATGPSARLAPWLPRRSATRLPSPPIRQ